MRSPQRDSDHAITAYGVTKRYDDEVAVEDLSLSIPAGSVYGFLGPNGAGKTTTMEILTTLTQPTAGSATVAGVSITDRAKLSKRIGYLPTTPPIFDELNAWEQLRHFARLHEIPDDRADDRIEELLTEFNLRSDAHRRIGEYSTGMKKKVGVISTIIHDPDVVFLDEPTSGLDPIAARTVRETIDELASDDTTVFLSSHILPIVDKVADEIGVIRDGRLIAEGPVDELKAQAERGTATDLETVFLEITSDEDAI
ncbi:multidrug ABC transporter ATP-binding protein [Natrinema saccharevitans]|uniref:Multidrug ABC transporter ATP-binding protein n=2 Tax=Natrinema saccharevitans TaxID=301967 RepID=A0A1S8B1F6_9EURY|nr:ABC transporter ATP-binding protein [Natrinema saccharevitans]OLZ42659.1 multidrug ABC transporter ATP-binding protein [Natrinema saccharevitans]